MNQEFLPVSDEEKLVHLIEECSELIKAASKVLRFGLDNYHPDTGKSNSVSLLNEIMDVQSAIVKVRELIARPTNLTMVTEVTKWYNRSTLRQQAEFSETAFEDLVIFMDTLGYQIINYFNLWHYKWEKKIVNGVDISPEHPEAVALRIIETLWRNIKHAS